MAGTYINSGILFKKMIAEKTFIDFILFSFLYTSYWLKVNVASMANWYLWKNFVIGAIFERVLYKKSSCHWKKPLKICSE